MEILTLFFFAVTSPKYNIVQHGLRNRYPGAGVNYNLGWSKKRLLDPAKLYLAINHQINIIIVVIKTFDIFSYPFLFQIRLLLLTWCQVLVGAKALGVDHRARQLNHQRSRTRTSH